MDDHTAKKVVELLEILPEIKKRPGMFLPSMGLPTERVHLVGLDHLIMNFCWGAGIDDTPLRALGCAGLATLKSFDDACDHVMVELVKLLEDSNGQ